MARKLTIMDVIHFYLAHYCSPVPLYSACRATMWSEMNDIRNHYCDCIKGKRLDRQVMETAYKRILTLQ